MATRRPISTWWASYTRPIAPSPHNRRRKYRPPMVVPTRKSLGSPPSANCESLFCGWREGSWVRALGSTTGPAGERVWALPPLAASPWPSPDGAGRSPRGSPAAGAWSSPAVAAAAAVAVRRRLDLARPTSLIVGGSLAQGVVLQQCRRVVVRGGAAWRFRSRTRGGHGRAATLGGTCGNHGLVVQPCLRRQQARRLGHQVVALAALLGDLVAEQGRHECRERGGVGVDRVLGQERRQIGAELLARLVPRGGVDGQRLQRDGVQLRRDARGQRRRGRHRSGYGLAPAARPCFRPRRVRGTAAVRSTSPTAGSRPRTGPCARPAAGCAPARAPDRTACRR